MRLGGPVPGTFADAHAWMAAVRQLGYSAVYCPCTSADDPQLSEYLEAARKANILIAEVGAWSNPISRDEAERKQAIELCCARLHLAEVAGARCCVNISGSCAQKWDGPHPDNLAPETFELVVQTVREIIDRVRPTRTCYTLETMPWIFPDSPDSYLDLIRAVDRRAFAVHLDPVNLINCPARAFRTGDFLRECFAKLGPFVRSCHAKDIQFTQHLTVHLDECRPGTGALDYQVFLTELSKLDADTPLMLEHLRGVEQYAAAAEYIRGVAAQLKLPLY